MSCPRCREGDILPGEPTGTIESEFLGAYFAPAPSSSTSESGGATVAPTARPPSKNAVILLTDAFGLLIKNNKILADEFAKRLDCDVWVPDYFTGSALLPVDAMILPERAGIKLSLWTWIKFYITIGIPNLPSIIWNRPAKTDPRVEESIRLIKEKRKYEKIGAVGYCFGGSTAARFGSRPDLVDSIAVTHPGLLTIEDVRKIRVPVAWVCAEDDYYFADTLRDQAEAEFASRKGKDTYVDYEVTVYKGTAHGFASRPNFSFPEIKEGYEGALNQTVEWFKKTLRRRDATGID